MRSRGVELALLHTYIFIRRPRGGLLQQAEEEGGMQRNQNIDDRGGGRRYEASVFLTMYK
jgi:hypothetical protein